MTSTSFLPIEFDLAATFLMAMTGVWVASRRGYDILGALTLAFVSGVGGGLLRDSIFLSLPPAVLQNPLYLAAVLAAVVVGVLFRPLRRAFRASRGLCGRDSDGGVRRRGGRQGHGSGDRTVGGSVDRHDQRGGWRAAARHPRARGAAPVQARSVLRARGARRVRALRRARLLRRAARESRRRQHLHDPVVAHARDPL